MTVKEWVMVGVGVDQLRRWHDALVRSNIPDPDKYPEDAEAHLAALDDMLAALDRAVLPDGEDTEPEPPEVPTDTVPE